MEIIQINDEKIGIFQAREGDRVAGELFYTWSGKEKFTIDHTEVISEFEGKGIGKKLVMEAVKFAREKNLKILLYCSFAKKIFEKTPEIKDVLF